MKMVLGVSGKHTEERAEILAAQLEEMPEKTGMPTEEPVVRQDTADEAYVAAHGEALYEARDKRTENGKHYVQNDGVTKAIYTAQASLKRDESTGEYAEIDSSVRESATGYETDANGFRAGFKKDLPAGKIYELEKHGCKVSLCTHGDGCRLRQAEEDSREFVVEGAVGAPEIRYTVDSDRVKENIVIREKADAYVYDFTLNIDKLDAAMASDGACVELKNTETGEVEFTIPRPFLYDANGVYSDMVYYEIERTQAGTLTLKVIADAGFVNAPDRAFPVTIDPQIVAGDSSIITYQNYILRAVTSSYGSPIRDPIYGYSTMRASSYGPGYDEYTCTLTIHKTRMNLTGRKIASATLKLRSQRQGNCYIDGAYFSVGSNTISVDLTSRFRNSAGDITLNITAAHGSSVEFYTSGSYAPTIEVEYITDEKTVPTVEEFSLSGGARVLLNLHTGDPAVVVPDMTTDGTALPVTIQHVYKRNSSDFGCGTNWRLNLHQKLTKISDSALGADYIYTDELGDRHGFKEYFYYCNQDGNKQYISKSQVVADLSGKLTYNGHEVKREQKSATGLKLVTQTEGVKRAEWLEQKSQEQSQLEEQVLSEKYNLKNSVVVNKENGDIVKQLADQFDKDDNLSADSFESYFSAINTSQMVLTKDEAMQYNSLLLQKVSTTAGDKGHGKYVYNAGYATSGEYSDDEISNKRFQANGYSNYLSDLQKLVSDLKADYATLLKRSNYVQGNNADNYQYDEYYKFLQEKNYKSSNCQLIVKLISEVNVLGENPPAHLINNYCDLQAEIEGLDKRASKLALDCEANELKNGDSRLDVIGLRRLQATLEEEQEEFNKEFSNRADKLKANIDKFEQVISDFVTKEQSKLITKQIGWIQSNAATNKAVLKKLFKSYHNHQYELDQIIKYTPTAALVTEDGVQYGFNADGYLVAIYDAYENTVMLEYIDKGQITRLYDGENRQIVFKYRNGRLASLSDDNGHTVKYGYNGNNLTSIVYPDGETLTFAETNGSLTTVESNDYTLSSLDYSGKRLTAVYTYSLVAEVNKNTNMSDESSTRMDGCTLSYSYAETVLQKQDNTCKHWLFNAEGNVCGYYETENGKVTETVSRDYVADTCTFTVRAKKDASNHLSGVGAKTGANSFLLKTLNASELNASITDYVFSAYATATTAKSFTMRRQTEFYSENMSASPSVRFEIRAEVVYPSKTKTFVMSGDWRNANKQLLAVPVTLDEDAHGDAVLPTSIRLYADSTRNTSVTFNEFTFAAGEWEYTLLDLFGNPTVSETNWEQINIDSFVKAETEYDYDDEQQLTEKRTKHSFNLNNELTTKTEVEQYFYNTYGKPVKTVSFVEGEELAKGKSVQETEYDAKGNAVRSFTYNTLDSSSKLYSEQERDEKGTVTADLDETGEHKTVYEYAAGRQTVVGYRKPNGGAFRYGHDETGRVTSITQSTETGEGNSTSTSYNCGLPTQLRSGANTVEYTYDAKRRKKQVILNGEEHVRYAYVDGECCGDCCVDVVSATLLDMHTVTKRMDKKGNVLSVAYSGSDSNAQIVPGLQYTYNEQMQPLYVQDEGMGNGYSYEYNALHRKIKVIGTQSSKLPQLEAVTEAFAYDKYGDLATYTIGSSTYTYGYENTLSRRLNCVTLPGGGAVRTETDALGRESAREITYGPQRLGGTYTYYRKVGDHATGMISAMRYGSTVGGRYAINEGEKYTYDAEGNITAVYENGLLKARYTYDTLGRLIREDNKRLWKTYLYTYDDNGNILHKETAAFTLAERDAVTGTTQLYAYEGDRLTAIDGTAIEFDSMGNPSQYKGNALQWQFGRQLAQYGSTEFRYDSYGRRVRKGSIYYSYTSDGKLYKQSNGIEYLYDDKGICGILYNGERYYYRKNAQGDVVAMLDKDGVVVVRYEYDAWGNHEVYDGAWGLVTSETHIGKMNPLRYRGYYYDVETGLYYLQSRYYDPTIGRFLSMDDVQYIDAETLNGLNLYAYCGNNPVMCVDPTGTMPKWLKWAGGILLSLVLGLGGIILVSIANPALGSALQVVVSALAYVGIAIGTIFSPTLRADMNRIGWNPFNTDETAVLGSSSVSFYKGVPVFRTNADRSGTFLAIFLSRAEDDVDSVRHEWGHIPQQMMLGPISFSINIGIPSAAELGSDKWPTDTDYYNRPWETMADIFGGVTSRQHTAGQTKLAWRHMLWTYIFGPSSFIFCN